MGYSPAFYRSIGRCADCGGQPDYPMLLDGLQRLCGSDYHSFWSALWFRLRCAWNGYSVPAFEKGYKGPYDPSTRRR